MNKYIYQIKKKKIYKKQFGILKSMKIIDNFYIYKRDINKMKIFKNNNNNNEIIFIRTTTIKKNSETSRPLKKKSFQLDNIVRRENPEKP